MMHMTFYWGKQATILFDGWKTSTWTNYLFSLLALFLVSIFYQYLTSRRTALPSCSQPKSDMEASLMGRFRTIPKNRRLVDSALFGITMGIAYMLMLAVMSFNAGVFLAVVLGLAVGYYLFRSESAATALSSEADPCCS